MSFSWSDCRPLRAGLVILGAALLLNFHFFTLGWSNTLLGGHEFRQVQTAISTYYFLHDGISLHYLTPVLGPPWEVPLEFPLFQASAALVARWTELDLDIAGRLTSWLFFLGAIPPATLLLRRFRLPAGHQLFFPALLLLNPIYLFYSHGFLIESAALCASCWFLLCFERFLGRPRLAWLAGAFVAGSLGGMIKVTTFIVFLVVALFFLVAALRSKETVAKGKLWLRAALAVGLPCVATLWWVAYTVKVRHQNPEAVFLDSHFGFWTFGDFSQRISWAYWSRSFRVWADGVVGEAGLLLVVFYFLFVRGPHWRVVLACLAAFLSGQLIFSNLYWVHDYYFYASTLFFLAALGFCVSDLLEHPRLPAWGQAVLVTIVLVFQVSAYTRTYFGAQVENQPVPVSTELVKWISEPDETIVIFGQDWDGSLPYYAGRKALMFLRGREADEASMRRSIARLDPHKVAAVIMSGFHWRDTALVNRTMAALHLGDRPFIFNLDGFGVWVPEDRQDALRDRFDSRLFPDFMIAPIAHPSSEGITLRAAQIRRRPEFAIFSPRPVHAHASHDFTLTTVNLENMLVANSISELTFDLPEKSTRITGTYGLADDAYTGGHTSDGIELTVTLVPSRGKEQQLYSRYVNPQLNDHDRGPQKFDVALPPGAAGQLIVRILPGPHNDASYDWSYIGNCTIHQGVSP